jgi:hypothetical protein
MKRIKLVLAVGVVMAALLALNAGTALAHNRVDLDDRIIGHKIEEIELESDGVWDIELKNGDDIEFYDYDLLDDLVDNDDLLDDDEYVHVINFD